MGQLKTITIYRAVLLGSRICIYQTLLFVTLAIGLRGVARGGGGGGRAPRNLVDQLTLFKPWGVDYAHHTTARPPGFKMLSTPLADWIYHGFNKKPNNM